MLISKNSHCLSFEILPNLYQRCYWLTNSIGIILIVNDTSGFMSNTLLIRYPIILSVHISLCYCDPLPSPTFSFIQVSNLREITIISIIIIIIIIIIIFKIVLCIFYVAPIMHTFIPTQFCPNILTIQQTVQTWTWLVLG